MKTLFENLKPEFLEKLEIERIKFPNLTQNTINELKENCFWSNLTVSTAQNLCSLDNNKNLGILELANLFDNK